MLEDKYLCLVQGINPRGKLLIESDGQRNEWLSDEEFATKEKSFGGLEDVQNSLDSDTSFVFEKTFTYPLEDY